MSNQNEPEPKLCPECRSSVNDGANRCGNCGVVLSKTKRRILQGGALISALLVAVPLWQLAVSSTDLLKTEVSFEVEPAACGQQGIALSFVNFERDRFLEWSNVRLHSINGVEIDEAMIFQPGQARHIPPLSSTHLEFFRQSNSVPTSGATCSNGCTMVVKITAQEPDGDRPTEQTAKCTWTVTQPALD